MLSYKAFLIYALVLFLLRLFLGALPTRSAAVDSNAIMALINNERVSRNLPALFANQSLLRAATQKTQDMIDRDYFAHVDPDGNYVWTRIVAAGYTPYKILGENLAVDFATSEGMVKAWIDSPTHRANLLHTDFVDQGLSAQYGDFQGRYTNLTTSLFGALAIPAKPKPQVKSEPPKTAPPDGPQKTPPPQTPPAAPAAEPPTTPTTTAPQTAVSQPVVQKSGNLGPGPRETQEPENANPAVSNVSPSLLPDLRSAFAASRVIFTLFGILLLIILAMDSIIITKHEMVIARSHSTYHLFTFILIVLVSILIWWW